MHQPRMIAKTDESELGQLQRRLALQIAAMTPGEERLVRGIGSTPDKQAVRVPSEAELDDIAAEILDCAAKGLTVITHAETRPLMPLYEANQQEVPAEIAADHELLHYDFYCLQMAFNVLLDNDDFTTHAQLDIALRDDILDQGRRSVPVRIFPDKEDLDYFKYDLEGGVGVDGDLDFRVPAEDNLPLPFTTLSAHAKRRAGLLLGPFAYRFRQADIDIVSEDNQGTSWRYNLRSGVRGTNQIKSLLILKVAQEAQAVDTDARLCIVPCRTRWLLFREQLPRFVADARLPVQLALTPA